MSRPHPSEKVRQAVHEESHALLVERLRGVLWLAVVTTTLSVVLDADHAGEAPSLIYVRVAAASAYVLLLASIGRIGRLGWAWSVATATTVVCVFCTVTAGLGIVTGEFETTTALLMLIAVGGGIVFPWGPRVQLVVVCAASLAFVATASLAPPPNGVAPNLVLTVFSALAVSLYLGHTQERHRFERTRAELLRAGEQRILQLIVLDADALTTLDTLLEGLEVQLPDALCLILLADEDGRRVRRCAAPSLAAADTSALEGAAIGSAAAIGPDLVVCDDLARDPRWRALGDLAARRALAAGWGQAIVSGRGDLLGILAVCHRTPRRPSAWERELIDMATYLARITMDRQLTRRQLERYVRSLDEARAQAEDGAALLAQARDQALASARAKADFLATMSHEIRTPMNGIFGMTELALDSTDDDERREALTRARACAESLMTVLNDILDFSKIEAGKLDLECIPFEPRAVVGGVLDTLAIEASRKRLELVAFVDEQVPAHLRGDPGRFRQVLLNLGSNALKFTPHGEVVIRITPAAAGGPTAGGDAAARTPADDPGGIVLHCAVQDTGIGIPREQAAAIFEAFTQADSSTTRCYGGTGLGLAISQRLVGLMGGAIGVESEVGQGSTFWFTARFEPAEGAAVVSPSAIPPGLRILVVDDNATNRLLLMKTLEAHGCRPVPASSGHEACDLVRYWARAGEAFDLVMLDMHMPGLDGAATARRIRAERESGDVPIVILSSIGSGRGSFPDDVEPAAVLSKPVKEGQLLEVVARARRRPPAVDAASSPAA